MSECRKSLRWLCLDSGFFDNAKVKVIRSGPDGERLLLTWIGLLCLAAKHGGDGQIMLSRNLPLDADTLALLLGEPVPVVTLALQTFARLDMIELVEASAIRIVGWDEHQHTAGLQKSRERKRLRDQRYRERQRKELSPATGAPPSPAGSDPFAGLDEATVTRWRPAFEALTATGKLPALTVEHLCLVAHDHPRAKLAENFPEIAAEASGVVGTIGATLPWLRKAVGALELRIETREAAAGTTAHKF